MICKECGADVSSTEVFCPQCGSPLRVTADYDYIQAEIGGKVDQVLNDTDDEFELNPPAFSDETYDEPELTIIGEKTDAQMRREADPEARQRELAKEKERLANTLAVTRTLYVKDSIFADEEAPEPEEEAPKPPADARPGQDVRKRQAQRKRQAEERARKKKRNSILAVIIAVAVIGAVVGLILAFSGSKEKERKDDVITTNVEDGGTYAAPLEITLWSDQDSRLVYTLDGSEPGISSGMKYGEPFTLKNEDVGGDSRQITLTVVGFKKDATVKTGELKVTFTLTRTQPAPPSIDVPSGDYYGETYISLFAEEGMTIYFTFDGSTPSTSSERYSGPIEMKRGSNVLSAIAVDSNGVSSEVTSAVYNLNIEANYSYEDAFLSVINTLVSQGLIESATADADGYYKVPGGGKRRIINGGTAIVENSNYYVVQVDYMNDGSSVQATTYYGVNDQTGQVFKLNRSGMSYVIG